ncbi:putative MFS family arabinose efflux permease [Rhizobium sp. PP-F2F-G38]|uniref:MFS transporter n=1 Tax=Rhizobium sp. PP-CC-3G-465 TaxID=2135648 RepID=UPI000DA0854A|nr:putative MFS family arabinose efflux permease [Rhizobium sp. PP-WC-1G-195]PYE92980.1 putative MFS family arabinose efflux permease [Rhizobium sp. PP-F2F-G38]TCP79052.1 putative MFS family arabinose efflux permease [Rhizobium sp. PP-CC-2G-626]TCQ15920.1 putative MFS family arabinose efflux permease [Rhizobium sp. PP-CC-3G-465]
MADTTLDTLSPSTNWAAVWATGLGVSSLTAAEMLPVSLLTPMGTDLGITEGMAGQAVTATAVVALVTSIFIAVTTRGLDRRTLLLWLSAIQILSNLTVAFAPNLFVLLIGRMFLGLSLGGFWALSAALAMRLVPEDAVPKAFSIIFGGVSVATVAAAPIGSYLGSVIGWRGVFTAAAVLAIIGFVWQFVSLPSMPSRGKARLATLFHVLKRPRIGLGMSAVVLVFAGHFAFFTYLRPFLETVTNAGVNGVTLILLAFGIGSFVGTSASGWLLKTNLWLTLWLVPLLMSALAIAAVILGGSAILISVIVALWGFSFGTIPVGWSTWLTRTVPDEAESGGGLLVAAIQIAMTIGAALGGAIVDVSGITVVFVFSAAILLAATVAALIALQDLRKT